MITKSDCREVWTEADEGFLTQNYAQGNLTTIAKELEFLKMIYPYLIEKKEKANLAIEFLESRLTRGKYLPYSDKERELRDIIIKLNKRGREKE